MAIASLVHQWVRWCGRVSLAEGRRKLAAFFLYIFEVSPLHGSNDFITAVGDVGGLCAETWRCVLVCVVEGGVGHLEFFSITQDLEPIL